MQRNHSLQKVKTYNMFKNFIWACVLETSEDEDKPKSEMEVDLELLRDLIMELRDLIRYSQMQQ